MNVENLRQKKQHGKPSFPFAVYQNCIPLYGKSYKAHCHNEVEIIFMHKGRCEYFINDENILLEEGNMLFISPEVVHSYHQYDDNPCYASIFIFHLDLLINKMDLASQNYFIPLIKGKCNPYFTVGFNDRDYTLYAKIIENLLYDFLQRTPFFELKIKSSIMQFFIKAFEDGKLVIEREANIDSNLSVVKKTIEYIENNYSTDINLDVLSRVAGVSTYRLSHMFRDMTGKSCIDYVIDYRLSVIADQLKNTEEPITEIAVCNGFNNISNFNYAFRKKYKMTPTRYRKTARNQM